MRSWRKFFKKILRKMVVALTVFAIIFSSLGSFAPVVKGAASTITEAVPPTELLSGPVVAAKASAMVAVDTFSLIQASDAATLNSISVVIVDPGTSGLVNTDIASISLRKESTATPGFQAGEDLAVVGAVVNNPAIGAPITLTPTTPEVIGVLAVQYYIIAVIAATPVDNHNFAVNFGVDYGIDNTAGTIGSAFTATKKVLIDITPPAPILVQDFVFIQNPPGTPDQIAPAPAVSIGMQNSIIKVYQADGTTFIDQATLGADGRFAPINVGDNTNASVKLQVVDPAGNTNTMIAKTGNDIVAPTIASAAAFTDRIILNFSENVDGMMASNCANYTVNGSVLSCSGPGTPFIDFQGNKATIRGLSLVLSSTATLAIAGNAIRDISGGQNPLAAYTNNSLSVSNLTLPTITNINPTSGAVGDSITIAGTYFGNGPAGANYKVFFSGGFNPSTGPLPPIEATSFTSWSATSIVVAVPAGAQGGPVNVMVGGVMSDMNQNSFFDITANYITKIYYVYPGTLMPEGDKDNIRIAIGGPNGLAVHYILDGTGTTTYNAGTNEFTITGVSSMGWTWAYDITGAHLNSQGQQVDVAATQNHILTATSRKISGTITLGAPCTAGGQNKDVVVFAMPDQVDTGGTGFKPTDPAFFKTNGSCTTSYSVGIPTDGVYRVEAHIPPDINASTVSSSAFTDPDALSVTISGAGEVAGKNFAFPAATHRIIGTVQKPGGFGEGQKGMLWVFAYQPREGGKGTGTQVANDGTFTLNVTAGTWKVGVGGENMSFPVEVQVDVDDTYLIPAIKGPTIIIAPPSDFIEGYVKDSAGNGLANSSLYAWLEGAPGGGNAQTDSQGYYKMYVTPGSNYHIGANSQAYGFLGEQSGVVVSSGSHPTVNFTVSSSNNYTISGTITKNTVALQQAFVFITEGENGQMLGSGGTDATGAYTVRTSGGSNRWIHVGLPGKGEIYAGSLALINGNRTENISITSLTIKVRISPASSFTQAFVGVHSDTSGGFSDTPVVTASCTGAGASCREYQIDIRQPSSGSTTYYVDGGIPGYGPLPQVSVGVDNAGNFTEVLTAQSGGLATDGIIEITLGGFYEVSGTVSGTNVQDAWVFASGPNGGDGSAVAANGSYTMNLRNGIYDIGVGKPGYIGNKITTEVNGAAMPAQNLTLTTATNTITGTVYLPGGTTTATNAWVWAENGSGGWAGGSTDASGNYSLSVGSGSWTVKAAYDGYNSTGILVTAPASGKNITLITVSGFTPNTKNAPITPSDGGIVSGTGIKVDFPKNALGTGTTAGTVEVKSTTNVVLKNDRQLIGTAKEITARNSSNQNVTTLSGSITIELTLSKAELMVAALTFAQAQAIKITYFDSTGGSWVEIPTVVTLSVPTATTIPQLNDDPAITLTGTTTHLSTYAPSIPTDADAPPVPTDLSISAGNTTAALSWAASAGATKYDIYKKIGDDYPYLAQTTSTSYTATGLTNGTAYYFKVSALDNSNKESAASSFSSVTPAASSIGGGGGGSYTPVTSVTNASVSINNGAASTASTAVSLTLAATNATHMAISNAADFSGVSWETFAASKSWILTAGDGLKTVYAKFRDAAGVASSAVSDTITLGSAPVPTPTPTPAPTVAPSASASYPDGTLLKSSDAPEVYVIRNGNKVWIKSAEEFNAAGYKWDNILLISKEKIDSYNTGSTISGKTIVIVPVWLRVRSSNSTKSAELGRVNKNENYSVLEENNGWYKIQTGKGIIGWVSGAYATVKIDSAAGSGNESTIVINVPSLRIRSTSSTVGKMLGLVKKGAIFSVLEENNGWHKIKTNSGIIGWVSGSYVIKK